MYRISAKPEVIWTLSDTHSSAAVVGGGESHDSGGGVDRITCPAGRLERFLANSHNYQT